MLIVKSLLVRVQLNAAASQRRSPVARPRRSHTVGCHKRRRPVSPYSRLLQTPRGEANSHRGHWHSRQAACARSAIAAVSPCPAPYRPLPECPAKPVGRRTKTPAALLHSNRVASLPAPAVPERGSSAARSAASSLHQKAL